MKKFLCIIYTLVFLASLVGCAASSSETVVLPPARIGSSDIKVEFETKYTFASALSEADVVARIEVGNWLGEDTDLHKTYYEATVLQCFKGDIPNEFTLLQDGCSAATLKNYPLFTSGNELLVFLNKATVTDYDSPYWIIGSFMTVLDVAYDASGTRYYSDRYGILGETVDVSKNFSLQDEISAEVYSELVETDSIIADMRYSYPYIFSENDLIPLLENQ